MPLSIEPPAPGPLSVPRPWDLVSAGYAEVIRDHFVRYAQDALTLARVGPADEILDVATGPGSLALTASPLVARVEALDFSAGMLAELETRRVAAGARNVTARQGDGQALPYADASFDAAFSMFGLIFFPDRARGFRELRRVLRPGGRAVVSSWHPMEEVPIVMAVLRALPSLVPGLAPNDGRGPLSDPEALRVEMEDAGFVVEVHETAHAAVSPSLEVFWRGFLRSFAPFGLLRENLGAQAFGALADTVLERLRAQFGDGPVQAPMPAWLALGRTV